MNRRLKKLAGALAIIVGVLFTWEAATEANMMFMAESICLAVIGMCYVLPVREAIKHLISEAESKSEYMINTDSGNCSINSRSFYSRKFSA